MIEFISSAASRSSTDLGRQQVCLRLEGLEDRCTPTVTYWVNTDADNGDPDPRPGLTADANGKSSLRAVIEDGNASAEPHVVNFTLMPAGEGEPPQPLTISLQKALPVLAQDFWISGLGAELIFVERAAGPGRFRIFEIGPGTECQIYGLSIINGHVEGEDSKGGGVLNNGHLELLSCKIFGNKAGSGGGVASIGERLDMSDCQVYQNTAQQGSGGGLYVRNGILDENSSHIHENTAKHSGGGVYLAGATADFYEPYIFLNTAEEAHGGGLFVSDSRVDMSEGKVWANTAAVDGGGICVRGDGLENINLTEMAIQANQASGNGGGIYLFNDEMGLHHVIVEGNDCNGDGGGIYQESGTLIPQRTV